MPDDFIQFHALDVPSKLNVLFAKFVHLEERFDSLPCKKHQEELEELLTNKAFVNGEKSRGRWDLRTVFSVAALLISALAVLLGLIKGIGS